MYPRTHLLFLTIMTRDVIEISELCILYTTVTTSGCVVYYLCEVKMIQDVCLYFQLKDLIPLGAIFFVDFIPMLFWTFGY